MHAVLVRCRLNRLWHVGAGWFSKRTRRATTRSDTDYVRLRGPGGITVEQVDYEDKAGHRQRVLRARQYGVHLGDFRSVEELANVVDVSELVEEDSPGQAATPPA